MSPSPRGDFVGAFWGRLVGSRPIVTRLVLAVAAAMTVVLVCGAAFVYWRVSYALSRQLDRDLDAYHEVAENAVQAGRPLVRDTPGLSYQVYDLSGRVVGGDAQHRLIRADVVRDVAAHGIRRGAFGHVLTTDEDDSYRYIAAPLTSPTGKVVAAFAISQGENDEALRELLLQLLIADVATLVAASFVGYRTARGALDPVERYRVAAATAGEDGRLPVSDRDDELSRLGHTFNDLLDRIARSAERERHFLADASHELRGPLTVMRTEVEWALLQDRERAAAGETLESLRGQVDRLVGLCNSLLDLEELRAEEAATGSAVLVADLAGQVAARWRDRLAAQGRGLVLDVGEDLEVTGDPHWLDLALGNLVSNAQRYGAGTVRISGRVSGRVDGPRAGDLVQLIVEDEGAGFPPDFVERAFDRFARADESRSSGGTGLGLALVAAVVANHHGTVAIDGSRVTMTLPAVRHDRDHTAG